MPGRKAPPPKIMLIFNPSQDHYHASALYVGLDELARHGLATLRFRPPSSDCERYLSEDPLTVCLKVEQSPGSGEQIIAIDLKDKSDVFSPRALEISDKYLKRSFYREHLAKINQEFVHKVLPFGLNFSCRSFGSSLRLFWSLINSGWAGPPYAGLLYQHFSMPSVARFEQTPDVRLDRTVTFQTRVWEPDDIPGEISTFNEERVNLVRALKKTFGSAFNGGLVPTRLAHEHYPDEITPLPTKRTIYTAMSKRNLVGVYSRGLYHSNAFKLSEYLAASQCIVADAIRHELPVPLEPGKHYLPFSTPQECVEACQRLLSDTELATSMRKANCDYYITEVKPAAHVMKALSHCITI